MASTLEQQHLADLHRRAAELGVERYRTLTREELAAAILERDPDAAAGLAEPRREDAEPEERRGRRRHRRAGAGEEEAAAGGEEEAGEGEPVVGVLDITPGATASSGSPGSSRMPRTSTSPLRRFAAASCSVATRSPGRRGGRAAASAIRR